MINMDNNYDLVYEQDMAYLQSLYEDEQKQKQKQKRSEVKYTEPEVKYTEPEVKYTEPEVKYTEPETPEVKLTLHQLRAQRISHFEKSSV